MATKVLDVSDKDEIALFRIVAIDVPRMHFDHLPSGGLLDVRGRVLGKMQDQLKADLAGRKAAFAGR